MAAEAAVRTLAAGNLRGGQRTVVSAVPVERISPNPAQPRRHFDEAALAELAASVRKHGLLQPIIVCHVGAAADGQYQVMAGERRFRACKMAGLQVVPVLVRDDDPIEVAMIENLQREDLSPLEEAEGLQALITQFHYTHETLAELIGKSRPYVSNTLALCRLPQHIKDEYHEAPVVSREILISVARAESAERQDMLWRLAKIRHLSGRSFRSAQSGERGSPSDVDAGGKLVRRLARRMKVALAAELTSEQRAQAVHHLKRARAQIDRTLRKLEVSEDPAANGEPR